MDQNQDPRWLQLRPSRIHLVLTVAGGLAAGIILALLPWPWWVQLALVAATILLALREMRRARLLGADAVTAFYLLDVERSSDAAGGAADAGKVALGIRLRHGAAPERKTAAEVEGMVQSGAYVTPWFSSLPYRLPDDPWWRQRWPRIISLWPDSLDADAFRRVRVQLKWK